MSLSTILSGLDQTRQAREELYRWLHQNPELSLQEDKTSQRIKEELDKLGIEHKPVGRTGVVAIIENGEGPIVAVRGDIDGLPVKEESGKDYASTATQVDEATGNEVPVTHACGHDVHISALLGALQAYNDHRDSWSGTFIGVFQPAEETAAGAKDMVANGITEVMPKPDVYLGQHVLGGLPVGSVAVKEGAIFSAASSIRIKIQGKGSHGSMPEKGVDPVVLASAIVLRLQTIVSREISAMEPAVVTVGAIHAGTKSNIIPDSAELLLNTRTYDMDTQARVHEAIERIAKAECAASRADEPVFEYYDLFPLTNNHAEPAAKVREAFDAHFGDNSAGAVALSASEDFSVIPDAFGTPYVYWLLGGFKDYKNAPGNHHPAFAPDMQPTLDRGIEAIVVASAAWLVK